MTGFSAGYFFLPTLLLSTIEATANKKVVTNEDDDDYNYEN